MESHELGKEGEKLACDFLKNNGFSIIQTNFYCRYGEMDIIAQDRHSLAFVEIKSRRHGSGLEQAVGPKKIRSLKLTARAFLQKKRIHNTDYRFIIVFVLISGQEKEPPKFEMIEDPF